MEETDVILLWGSNARDTHPIFFHHVLNQEFFKTQRTEFLIGAMKFSDWPCALPALIVALDANLPHNPRKMKSFITSWRLYLDALPVDKAGLDWRLSLVLHYLAQFEEPLFRKVEESPNFYNDVLVKFCQYNQQAHYLLDDGLELPYEISSSVGASNETGGYGTLPPLTDKSTEPAKANAPPIYPRVFWVSRLINQLATEYGVKLEAEMILRHLLHTGGAS